MHQCRYFMASIVVFSLIEQHKAYLQHEAQVYLVPPFTLADEPSPDQAPVQYPAAYPLAVSGTTSGTMIPARARQKEPAA